MRLWLVKKTSGDVIVTILKNKNDNTFSFVNLTKEHICPCRFDSIEDALFDMDEMIKKGKVISYHEIESRSISL